MSIAWVFPGQGSQRQGMGLDLLDRYPQQSQEAAQVIGRSIRDLCGNDDPALHQTRYAQPVLFVVSALSYLAARDDGDPPPRYLAGHSLGEYVALFAAGCFDFTTGVRLVQTRAAMMGTVTGGAMLAVVGLSAAGISQVLGDHACADIDVANFNSPDQTVLSGPEESIRSLATTLRQAGASKCVLLNVSVPAHSRYMTGVAEDFGAYLRSVPLAPPRLPVIANVTARPYGDGEVGELLRQQLCQPVRWLDSMRCLAAHGVTEVREIGPGQVLTKLWRATFQPPQEPSRPAADESPVDDRRVRAGRPGLDSECLGSAAFRQDYRVRYAYLTGSLPYGICGATQLARLRRAGLTGCLGVEGLPVSAVPAIVSQVWAEAGGSFGVSLPCSVAPVRQEALAELYLAADALFVEALACGPVPASLTWLRFAGAHRDGGAARLVMAHVATQERAEEYLRPPPEALLAELVLAGRLTAHEASVARRLPVSQDICVQPELSGDPDAPNGFALLTAALRLRDRLAGQFDGPPARIGIYDDIGNPQGVAAAFMLGADFVVTGCVNQCTAEAATSAEVKDLLAATGIGDTVLAPTSDELQWGGQSRVARRGTMFAPRAHRLRRACSACRRVEDLAPTDRQVFEERYFGQPLSEAWTRITADGEAGQAEITAALANPRHQLALLMRWYFDHCLGWAAEGVPEQAGNYQIRVGPAMAGFNQHVAGTPAQDWRHRHADTIAAELMDGAASVLRLAAAGAFTDRIQASG